MSWTRRRVSSGRRPGALVKVAKEVREEPVAVT
jgi:hypothetical protein